LVLEPPQMPSVEEQADWVEASCLFGEDDSSVFREDLRTALAESKQRIPKGKAPDRIVEDSLKEMSWREATIPRLYPFRIYNDHVERIGDWQNASFYSFMLLLSIKSFYQSRKAKLVTVKAHSKLFERLATLSMKEHLARSIAFGFPRSGAIPRGLEKALVFFSHLSHETVAKRVDLRKCEKDAGVDVIAWYPIDNRSGQIVMLVQCTIEEKWINSGGKLSLGLWDDLINFVVTPIRALAFPYVCHTEWVYSSDQCGLLLDRLRIASTLSSISPRHFMSTLIQSCSDQLPQLRWFK